MAKGSDFFKSAEQLKDAFQLEQHPEYIEYTPFTKYIGFSIQRPYPETSKFRAPVKKDGDPDTYALIGVEYGPVQQHYENSNRVPISVNISAHSRYISKHWDYNFQDDECPTEESVLASKRSRKPIELFYYDEFFYDHELNSFIDHNKNKIEGIQILNELFKNHLSTANKFKGRVLRWKMGSVSKSVGLSRLLLDLLKWLLKIIFGRSFESKNFKQGIWSEYQPEDLKLLKTERIEVFGYKASKNIIITFCVILFAGYLFSYTTGYSPGWLKGIAKNSFLSFSCAVLLIWILDHILPRILLSMVNLIIRFQHHLITVKFKFK